jgi:hypothetical protein
MSIASASDYLGDGIDTLVEEAVQYFADRMIVRFPEIKWEGESSKLDRRVMILGLLAEKDLTRRVNEEGKRVWKSTTNFIRHLGPAARELQPAPARLQSKDNPTLPPLVRNELYQLRLSQIFDREYELYASLTITFLKMRRGGELVRFRKNGKICWTTAERAPSVPEACNEETRL